MVKLKSVKGGTGVVDESIETDRAHLWNTRPFPMPGKNIIRTTVFWNKNFDIADGSLMVYDIMGSNIDIDLNLDKINNYSANLMADFSKVRSGTYFIIVRLNTETRAIPIVISR